MQGNIDFDSEASDDSSLDDYYDDDDNDNYEGAYKGNSLAGGGGTNQTEGCDQYSDPTSYSWCLMRYTTVRLALQKLQVFLPSVGIELAGKSLNFIAAVVHRRNICCRIGMLRLGTDMLIVLSWGRLIMK